MALNIFGGHGFVGKEYTRMFYDAAIGNISNVNRRDDRKVYSADILYLISTVHNYHIFDDPHQDINTNLNLLVDVLGRWKDYQESTGEKGVFNFVSSWSVYGNQKELPVKESAACDPHGWYIITKRCAEQLLIEYCSTYGLNYRILRFANIVGPGDAKVSPKKNVLQHNINLLAQNKDIELFGDGLFYRDLLHVSDTVRAVDIIISKGNTNEIYNVGNGHPIFHYKYILEYVKEKLGSSGKIIYKEPTEFQKKVPVSSFYMDVTKLRSLGFVAKLIGTDLFDTLIPTEKAACAS
jgi:nucleoside-diphosphate-sugar epimerase